MEDEHQPLEEEAKMTFLTLHQTTPFPLRCKGEQEEQPSQGAGDNKGGEHAASRISASHP